MAAAATPDPAVMNLLAERKSVLDFVSGDLTRLSARLPGDERVRLQRHLDSLRDLERKIAPGSGGGGGVRLLARGARDHRRHGGRQLPHGDQAAAGHHVHGAGL